MKFLTKRKTIQKILVAIILLLVINFTIMPYHSYANFVEDTVNTIGKELMQLIAWIGDVIMSAFNNFMLGANGFGSAMLDQEDANLENEESWLYVDESQISEKDHVITFKQGEIDTSSIWPSVKYGIPNMLYSPENIISNNIAALDANFLSGNKFNSIYAGGEGSFKNNAEEKSTSSASILTKTIANWYKSFQNIVIVGLLAAIVYTGICIILDTMMGKDNSGKDAQYKKRLVDWIASLCLVFFLHFILSGILMLSDKTIELLNTNTNDYIVKIEGEGGKTFRTNLTGLIRLSAQSSSFGKTAIYTIIYIALVIYTCVFTGIYYWRLLCVTCLTVIAPLVALAYPFKKTGINTYLMEFTSFAIQPVIYSIVYYLCIGSAFEFVAANPIFALGAVASLIPIEKMIKRTVFNGIEGKESSNGLGGSAVGGFVMQGLRNLSNLGGNNKGKQSKIGSQDEEDKGIFMPPSSTGELSSFGEGSEEEDNINMFGQNTAGNEEHSNAETIDEQLAREQRDMSVQDYREMGLNPQQWEEQRRQEIEQERSSLQNQTPIRNMQSPRRKAGEKPKAIKGYAGRMLKRGAKAAGKQIWRRKGAIARGAMKGLGTVIGGTVALGTSLASGADAQKTISNVISGGLAFGNFGANMERKMENTYDRTRQVGRDLRQVRNEEKYGYDYAREIERQKQNKKARKEFLRDDKQQRQYSDLAGKMGYKGDIKELMQAAADYKEAGITDDKLIQNSLQAEYSRDGSIKGRSHDKFVEVASFAHESGFGRDHITEAKKREQLDTVIDTGVKGDEKAKREAALMYADIFDCRNTYEKVGKFGATKMGEKRDKAS